MISDAAEAAKRFFRDNLDLVDGDLEKENLYKGLICLAQAMQELKMANEVLKIDSIYHLQPQETH
jgi:hypothetical protein